MLAGFKVIPLKHRNDRNTWHEIFIQEFMQKKSHPTLPMGRTLLILNIPPYILEEHLIFGFRSAGEVTDVRFTNDSLEPNLPESRKVESKYFSSKDSEFTFKSAFVVFRTSKALRKSLELSEVNLYENNRTILVTGGTKWTKDYLDSQVNENELQTEIEGFLNIFDAELEESKQPTEPEIDDEGWETVTKSRNSRFVQSERVLKKLEQKMEMGKKKKELDDFYKFQKNAAKQTRVKNLRKRFGEERRKVDEMKIAKRMKTLEMNQK